MLATVPVNLALSLANHQPGARVGVLDLDVFSHSIVHLLCLTGWCTRSARESRSAVYAHGIPPPNVTSRCCRRGGRLGYANRMAGTDGSNGVPQLLFDVDWRVGAPSNAYEPGLDVLVIDVPPGTGDVPLTLGQLAYVYRSDIVSTPQNVALNDVRMGITTFRKLSNSTSGLLLNTACTYCPSCSEPHHLFGSPDRFRALASRLNVLVLELPLLRAVSARGNEGVPYTLWRKGRKSFTYEREGHKMVEEEWMVGIEKVAGKVWEGPSGAVTL